MDRQSGLLKYAKKAKRSLNIEKMLPMLQYGIFFSFVLSLAILFVSRFFVFAYYDEVALFVACATLIVTVVYIYFKRIRLKEAIRELDSFYPYNELVTALSFNNEEHPLADSIMNKAINELEGAYDRFKKRPKNYWRPKVLLGILGAIIIMATLVIFPSKTQQEAQVVEKEREVIQEMEKEIAKLEKKAQSEEVKREMKELLEKLKEVETSEQALREVVKKQKELKLQQQKLQDKKLGENGETSELSEEELQKLKDLAEMQSLLAKNASNTQNALSKIGKPISFDLQNTIAKAMDSQTNESNIGNNSQNMNNQNGNSSMGNNNSKANQQQNNNQTGQGSNGSGSSQGQGHTGSGSGSNQGQGSNGTTGLGQGQGNGSTAGSGAGKEKGGRNLLSVPSGRLGESNEQTVDSGPIGEGDPAIEKKGPVPVTKGSVRPYEDVIGEYEEKYLQSTERLQLPKDLQNVVESYFSSIQSEE